MKKLTLIILVVCAVLPLFACSDKETDPVITTLPPVDTSELPDEDVASVVETELFTVNIYKTYAEIVLYNDKEDTEVVIPNSFLGVPVKIIGEYAFYKSEKLEKVTLPSSLIEIDRYAFEECSSLKEVVTNEGLEIIDQAAFRNSSLEKINLPSTLIIIGKQSFYKTNITELIIPDTVSQIPSYSFYGCNKLKTVVFGKRIESIDESAFYNCTSIETVVIPETLSKLGDYCFRGCTSLKKVFIPKNTFIGENSFYGCNELVIYTPKNARCIKALKTYEYSYVTCPSADKMLNEG